MKGKDRSNSETAATLVEYCLLLLVVALLAFAAVEAFGIKIQGLWSNNATEIESM